MMAATAIVCAHQPAEAREAARLDIPAGSLPQAIAELARQAGVSIGSTAPLPPIRTRALRGRFTIASALRYLLGPDLIARQVGPTAWRIEAAPRPAPPRLPQHPTPTAPPPEVVSDPIVVTATKQLRELDSTPFALAVVRLDGTVATAPSVLGSSWLASNVEGLALTGLGPGRNRMFVRGVADSPFNGQSQSTVAILLDDARLTYAAPDPDIRLVDVARVELLKGPQGSLFGTGALGGIYQIVTNRPDTNDASLSMDAGLQAVAHGGLGGSASAVVNLPLVRGQSALHLVGYAALEPGWIDTGSRRDSNKTGLWGARGTLRSAVGEDWVADLTGMVQYLNSRDSQYVYAPGARKRAAQLPEPHDNDLRHAAIRVSRPDGPVRIQLSSAMTWHDVTDRLDATVGASGFGMTDPSRLDDDRRYRIWDSEVRLDGDWGRARWLAGVSHLDATQQRALVLTGRTSTPLLLDEERRSSSDSALFGQLSLPFGDAFEATAGARLFMSSTELDRRGLAPSQSDDRRRTGLTPSAALSWRPRKDRLLFVRYGSAFRPGGLGSNGPTSVVLRGDELATLEAGWRETLGAGGRLDLGVYTSVWEHLQSDALAANGLIGTVDAGRARIIGAEASLDLPLGTAWHVKTGASVQSALLVRSALGTRLDDRRLPVTPTYTLRGELAREWRLGAIPLRGEAGFRYTGPTRLSFDPALDCRAGEVLETNLQVTARLGHVEVGLLASNLLGGSANTFAYGNPLRIATARQFVPQVPRSISVTVRINR